MSMKKTLCALVAVATLGLAGCKGPTVEKVGDFTGDGILDIMLKVDASDKASRGNWLFIGQKDGSYIRAHEVSYNHGEVKYFQTDKGQIYFFNGQNYVLSPQKK